MAINYLNKLFESSSTADPVTLTLGAAVPAGSLIVIGTATGRSAAAPGIVSISDTVGNTWDWKGGTVSSAGNFIAYSKTVSAMTTSDTITIDWNGAISSQWISGHAFDNADATPTDWVAKYANDTTPQVTLDVAGSDWLTFSVVRYLPVGTVTITPVNSSVSRDSGYIASNWRECFSRNGTTGTTHTIGGTTSTSLANLVYGVSFPYLVAGGGSGNIRGQKTLVGV